MLTFSEAMVSKPFTWRTVNYGDIAVHVSQFSPNGAVAVVTIDGGPDATPCNRFPELSDGTGFATEGTLLKRVRQSPGAEPTNLPNLETMSAVELRKYARENYSSIGRLTKKVDIIAAIRAYDGKGEVTF